MIYSNSIHIAGIATIKPKGNDSIPDITSKTFP